MKIFFETKMNELPDNARECSMDMECSRLCEQKRPDDCPLVEIGGKCRWYYVDDEADYWHTDCGRDFCFDTGGPRDNKYKFCPECGREIEVKSE